MPNLKLLNSKKVIVTGGAGFIGSHICEELVKIGANVVSLDDYSAGKEINIDFLKQHNNFTAERKSVCDTEGMDEIFDGADTIFHNAASKKNICLMDPKRDLAVNAEGTLNLLQYAMKHNVRKFVHASTGSVYGEPVVFPTTEEHQLKPVSYYGVSKLAGERYVDVFNHLYGLDTTIIRYFHVYGPRQESNEFGGVVSIFMRNALEQKDLTVFGHGGQVRSFTYVKDLVNVNLQVATNPISKGQVYNAASGIQISINKLAEFILSRMNHHKQSKILHGEPLLGDIMNFDVSNEKVKNHLAVAFEQDFFGTLDLTIQEYLDYFKIAV